MQYDTTNLDEAAYLALQGFPFTITRTATVSAIFSFTVGETFEEIRVKFWRGEVTVQLHHWLATRTGLKNAVARQCLVKQIASPSIVPSLQEAPIEARLGFPYYYREGNDVKYANFGKRPLHTERFKKGNAYRSREDALNRRNPLSSANPLKAAPLATPQTAKEKAGGALRAPA